MTWVIGIISAAVAAGCGVVMAQESTPDARERGVRTRAVWAARAVIVVVVVLGSLLGAFVGFVAGAGYGMARS
jgi:hypothetical protein